MDLNSIRDTAIAIAREAGALLLDGFGREKQIETKSSAVDFVTQFDRAAETLITDRLRAAFPGHGLLGEEGTDETGEIIKVVAKSPQPPKYQDVFGHTIVELAEKNPKIVGVTPGLSYAAS